MEKLLKGRKFFSGSSTTEKNDENSPAHPDVYCEGQNVNGQNAKEEQDFIMIKERRKERFFANYNKFF
jgi:hypothetical protein